MFRFPFAKQSTPLELVPNGWRLLVGFGALSPIDRQKGQPPPYVFSYTHSACPLNHKFRRGTNTQLRFGSSHSREVAGYTFAHKPKRVGGPAFGISLTVAN